MDNKMQYKRVPLHRHTLEVEFVAVFNKFYDTKEDPRICQFTIFTPSTTEKGVYIFANITPSSGEYFRLLEEGQSYKTKVLLTFSNTDSRDITKIDFIDAEPIELDKNNLPSTGTFNLPIVELYDNKLIEGYGYQSNGFTTDRKPFWFRTKKPITEEGEVNLYLKRTSVHLDFSAPEHEQAFELVNDTNENIEFTKKLIWVLTTSK